MNIILDYLFSIVIIIFVGYVLYEHFRSHRSDKYHNDSWRERRRNKYK